ncbi:MAG: hypothetical protein QF415_16145 [Candidatus Undinarchaeales archaeon]|jgi:hypothetical protein|nr:hypothetical protein [Candidatus Undinarchaeales archaeon]MDP7492362.1 hypothetical protein [Candidatus Undinarchaeales archaeon]
MYDDLETAGYASADATDQYATSEDLNASNEPGFLSKYGLFLGIGAAYVATHDVKLEEHVKMTANFSYLNNHLSADEANSIAEVAEKAVEGQWFGDVAETESDIYSHVSKLANRDGAITGTEAGLLERLARLR